MFSTLLVFYWLKVPVISDSAWIIFSHFRWYHAIAKDKKFLFTRRLRFYKYWNSGQVSTTCVRAYIFWCLLTSCRRPLLLLLGSPFRDVSCVLACDVLAAVLLPLLLVLPLASASLWCSAPGLCTKTKTCSEFIDIRRIGRDNRTETAQDNVLRVQNTMIRFKKQCVLFGLLVDGRVQEPSNTIMFDLGKLRYFTKLV